MSGVLVYATGGVRRAAERAGLEGVLEPARWPFLIPALSRIFLAPASWSGKRMN